MLLQLSWRYHVGEHRNNRCKIKRFGGKGTRCLIQTRTVLRMERSWNNHRDVSVPVLLCETRSLPLQVMPLARHLLRNMQNIPLASGSHLAETVCSQWLQAARVLMLALPVPGRFSQSVIIVPAWLLKPLFSCPWWVEAPSYWNLPPLLDIRPNSQEEDVSCSFLFIRLSLTVSSSPCPCYIFTLFLHLLAGKLNCQGCY